MGNGCSACLLDRSDEALEGFRLVHGEVSQYLTVQGDAFFIQLVNELGIRQPLLAHGSIDTYDPEGAVFAFLLLAADVAVLQALLQYVLGYGIDVFALTIEALGLFEDLFPSGPGCYCIY